MGAREVVVKQVQQTKEMPSRWGCESPPSTRTTLLHVVHLSAVSSAQSFV